MSVGYFRRIYGNFVTTDNRAVTASNYSPFRITAPSDSRLPNGGGSVISNLYDLNPDKVSSIDNLLTFASNYGKQTDHWNGVDVNLSARLRNGVLLQGGLSTGHASTDNCAVLAQLPEVDPLAGPYCHQDLPFITSWMASMSLAASSDLSQ